MKFFFFLIFLNFSFLNAADTNLLKKKLDTLKRQTVTIHNDIVSNNKELKKIKIDIERNSQKQIILKKRIKSGENIGRRLMFLLQEKIYQSPVTKIIKNLFFQSEDFVTKRIVREFFLKGLEQALTNIYKVLKKSQNLMKIWMKSYLFTKKKKRAWQ